MRQPQRQTSACSLGGGILEAAQRFQFNLLGAAATSPERCGELLTGTRARQPQLLLPDRTAELCPARRRRGRREGELRAGVVLRPPRAGLRPDPTLPRRSGRRDRGGACGHQPPPGSGPGLRASSGAACTSRESGFVNQFRDRPGHT